MGIKKTRASFLIVEYLKYSRGGFRENRTESKETFSYWIQMIKLIPATTPEEELVLVKQFRYGSQEFSPEPPGGVIEKDEDPIVAGIRGVG